MSKLTDDEVSELREILEYKDDLKSIAADRRAYTRVAAKLKTSLAWLTFVSGAILILYNGLYDWIKNIKS